MTVTKTLSRARPHANIGDTTQIGPGIWTLSGLLLLRISGFALFQAAPC